MDMKIRTALSHEAPELSKIALSSKAYWGYPEYYFKFWENMFTITAEFIDQHKVWIACDASTKLGFIAISVCSRTVEIEHLWILPKFIKQGIGRKLFEHTLTWCTHNNIDIVRIESDPNAVGFYQSLGAKIVGYVESKPKPRVLPVLELDIKTNKNIKSPNN